MRSTSIVYGFDQAEKPPPAVEPKIVVPKDAIAIKKEMNSTNWEYAHKTLAAKQIERDTLNSEQTPRPKITNDGMQSSVFKGGEVEGRFVTTNKVTDEERKRLVARQMSNESIHSQQDLNIKVKMRASNVPIGSAVRPRLAQQRPASTSYIDSFRTRKPSVFNSKERPERPPAGQEVDKFSMMKDVEERSMGTKSSGVLSQDKLETRFKTQRNSYQQDIIANNTDSKMLIPKREQPLLNTNKLAEFKR